MSILNRRYLRYVVLLPLAVMLVATLYFKRVTFEITNTLLAEKRLEQQLKVDLIADQLDDFLLADANWYTYEYEPIIAARLAAMDVRPYTFAALYDTNLEIVSERTSNYGDLFNPVSDPRFLSAIEQNRSGTFVLPFPPEQGAPRDMYVYYRWIPTDPSLSCGYLAVVAVSQYSITNNIADWVGIGAVVLIVVVTVLNITMAMLLTRLGYIYEQRKGDKHRGAR